MDVPALLVFVGGFAVCAGVVFLISIFGAKEETFEEALAKQRKANEKEKNKGKDKKKDADKKAKNWRSKKKDKEEKLDNMVRFLNFIRLHFKQPEKLYKILKRFLSKEVKFS